MGNVERLAVDVVIPAYNATRWISETVESALDQRGVMPRVVVVDNGLSDERLAVLARFGSRVTVIRRTSQGAAVARNVGVPHGAAPYRAFLDVGDIWAPDILEWQTGPLESHPELDLAFTDRYQFEDRWASGPALVPERARRLPEGPAPRSRGPGSLRLRPVDWRLTW